MASLQSGDLLLQLTDSTYRNAMNAARSSSTKARLHRIECQEQVALGSLTVLGMNDDGRTVRMLGSLDDYGRSWLDHDSLANVSSEVLSMEEFMKHKRGVFNKKLQEICDQSRIKDPEVVSVNGFRMETAKTVNAEAIRSAHAKTAHDLLEEVYQSAVYCFSSESKQAAFWRCVQIATQNQGFYKNDLRNAIMLYSLVDSGTFRRGLQGEKDHAASTALQLMLGTGAIELRW